MKMPITAKTSEGSSQPKPKECRGRASRKSKGAPKDLNTPIRLMMQAQRAESLNTHSLLIHLSKKLRKMIISVGGYTTSRMGAAMAIIWLRPKFETTLEKTQIISTSQIYFIFPPVKLEK